MSLVTRPSETDRGREFLTAKDVAKALRIGHDKVLRWIASGALPAIDVAHDDSERPRWRITGAAFNTFCESRAARPVGKFQRQQRKTVPAVGHVKRFIRKATT